MIVTKAQLKQKKSSSLVKKAIISRKENVSKMTCLKELRADFSHEKN